MRDDLATDMARIGLQDDPMLLPLERYCDEMMAPLVMLDSRIRDAVRQVHHHTKEAARCGTPNRLFPAEIEGLCAALAHYTMNPSTDPQWCAAHAWNWVLLGQHIVTFGGDAQQSIELLTKNLIDVSGQEENYEFLRSINAWAAEARLPKIVGAPLVRLHATFVRYWVLRDDYSTDVRTIQPSILGRLRAEPRAAWWLQFAGHYDLEMMCGDRSSPGGFIVGGCAESREALIRECMTDIDIALTAAAS